MNDVSGVMRKFKQKPNRIETFKIVTGAHKRSIWAVKNKFIVPTCFCNEAIFLNFQIDKMFQFHSNDEGFVKFQNHLIKKIILM